MIFELETVCKIVDTTFNTLKGDISDDVSFALVMSMIFET